MKRWLAFSVLIAVSVVSFDAQELPQESDSFDVEPPLLIQPEGRGRATSESAKPLPTPRPDAAQLAKQLERAKKSAVFAERLFKAGVFAKVEAEQHALRVVRLQADFANAQLAEIKERIASQKMNIPTRETGQPDKNELKIAVAQVMTAAETANANCAKAELEAAVLNLRRQKKLLALGSGRKSDVTRAEEKLANLKRSAQ